MAKFFKFHTFLLAFLPLILFNSAIAQPMPQQVVRIGLNYPQSGPYASMGLSQFRGAMMAADEINAQGGILNHQIQLVGKDSGSNVSKSRSNVKALLEVENVKMVFGGVSSDVAIAACELCQEKWIPFFGTLTYSTATTGEEAHRSCFRESYNSWMAAKILARYINRNYAGRRFFYITADYTWGWTTESSLRRLTHTLNSDKHPGVRTRLGTTNFIEQLKKVEAFEPDVIILILAGTDLVTALRQATVMGLKKRFQIIIPNMIRNSIVGSGPEAIEGVIGVMPWFWQLPFLSKYPRGITFVKKYKERYNDYPASAAASAYTILYEYKSAVDRAGTFDGPAVIRALEGHAYRTVKDTQLWRTFDHQSIQTVYLVKGKPATDALKGDIPEGGVELLDSMPGGQSARSFDEWLRVRRNAGKPVTLEKIPGE